MGSFDIEIYFGINILKLNKNIYMYINITNIPNKNIYKYI